ncbi:MULTISPECIES: ATP-binding protein [Nostoc]|uniref:ATP-binding protein n=1 Tax=Nostoc paludosum FACHB-159 TaxID=2692908 RepID=A0ABR8KH52_9NOSO|nr:MULTISPECIES: ATP-binding protein [Nostoc]MBD2681739.1 ATP-binding protein [Nostoc sp. FACHB-857]MBD2738106.1 ATP-binding protein [Nostoc paludosum FACHB-159]
MAEPLEQFKMETNFEGLIQLLAKSLYPEPDVFVRELIQNAHDSIVRRQEIEPDVAGRIDIELDSSNRKIIFRDNGIGMDRQDIKDFLSVIGSTGTGTARQKLKDEGRAAAYNLIGQFGIGMLSAFVVAEKVVVRTRKLKEKQAFAWHNTGSTDCILYADNRKEVGCEIIVSINPEYTFMLDEKRLREATVKYCDFVQFPISLNGQGPINAIDAPWHRGHWASKAEKEATYKQFINRRYPDVPLDVIPVEMNEPFQAKGALYITDQRIPGFSTTGVVDIFVRRMFVKSGDTTLLPSWAKFICGVIDSPDLQPTAARDNIQRNNSVFDFLQKRLGELIVERLIYLAEKEPNTFRQINRWHHLHLKGMAHQYDEFFQQVGELLLFETNRGEMSLREYLGKNATRKDKDAESKAPLYYFAYGGAAAQFYKLADARDWVVINAGSSFEEELLEKYAQTNHRTIYLERLDATDDPELFQRLNQKEEERFRQLELDLEGNLRRFGVNNVSVRMRRFDPASLPAVIILTPETEAEQKLQYMVNQPWFMEGMEDIAKEAMQQSKRRPLYLQLNAANELIQQLADMAGIERGSELVGKLMTGIYTSAILYSHNLLTQNNAEAIHTQFVGLLDILMKNRGIEIALKKELEEKRRQTLELQKKQVETTAKRPDHILIFMITPSDEYKLLEEAVRRVFERSPYCFEVQLAGGHIYKPGFLENVREHMLRAHGFIAEISDLNPNVMFELGAVMLSDDSRPIFSLRSQNAREDVPAALKEKLFVRYGSIKEPVETLEMAIRIAFERDGRIVHDGINALLAQRQKRFLSRMLLEALRFNLNSNEIASLMKDYKTVEDLLAAEPAEVAQKMGLQKYVIEAIQGELNG